MRDKIRADKSFSELDEEISLGNLSNSDRHFKNIWNRKIKCFFNLINYAAQKGAIGNWPSLLWVRFSISNPLNGIFYQNNNFNGKMMKRAENKCPLDKFESK